MRPRIVLMLFVLLVLAVSNVSAQLVVDRQPFLEDTDARIANAESAIPVWESGASWYLATAGCIMFLGLASSFLASIRLLRGERRGRRGQNTPDPDGKGLSPLAVTAILVGLAVSGLTWWLQNGFAADHRAYRKGALEARDTISQLKTQMNVFRLQPFEDIDELLEFLNRKITPLADDLYTLQTTLVALAVTSFETTLYAENVEEGLSATGTGNCNLLVQSEENSRVAAVEKLVVELTKAAGLNPTPTTQDTLREYVGKYARRLQSETEDVFRTTLTLNPTFANPKVLGPFLQSEEQGASNDGPEQQIDTIRQQFTANIDDGFLEINATVPLNGGAVRLEAMDPTKGSFVFTFDVQPRQGDRAELTLRQVDINQDASSGSTLWRFYILNGDTVAIGLPMQRWDDTRRPTRCMIDTEAGFSASVGSSAAGVRLTVVGLRPRVIEG